MDWFRLHSSIIDEPDVLLLSEADRWHYVVLLSVASQQEDCGSLPSVDRLAIQLRLKTSSVELLIDRLIHRGLVETTGSALRMATKKWAVLNPKSSTVGTTVSTR